MTCFNENEWIKFYHDLISSPWHELGCLTKLLIDFVCHWQYNSILTSRRGVEQWQLVGLITRRSQVRVLSPQQKENHRPSGLWFFVNLVHYGEQIPSHLKIYDGKRQFNVSSVHK